MDDSRNNAFKIMLGIMVLIIVVQTVSAVKFETRFNPFTKKLDYYTREANNITNLTSVLDILDNGTIIRTGNITGWDFNVADDWNFANNLSAILDNGTINRSIDLSTYNFSVDLSSYNHSLLKLSQFENDAGFGAGGGGDSDELDIVNQSILNNTGIFFNRSIRNYTANFTFEDKWGYEAANAICNDGHPGSHYCQESEIIKTTYVLNVSVVSGWFAEMWVSTGGGKFAPADTPVNDCDGQTDNTTGESLGSAWDTDSYDTPVGAGITVGCTNVLGLACCK
mgnify:CR=1 FL=1|jgi:hypothetical protein|tara:strand:+ start:157 stop:999 length:843 start_codon:yes stop_codon:yes gene_type:complete